MYVPTGTIDLSNTDAIQDNFKIAIVSPPGEGKSWLAASCATPEEPAFVWDFDGRRQSIAGKSNVHVKTIQDVNYPTLMPTSWQTYLTDIMGFENAKARGEEIPKWFIPDSATYMSEAALHYIMYNSPSLRREIRAGASITYVPKGFDTYKAEIAEVIGALQRLFCLGNVIMTFHIGAEKAPDSTQDNPKFTGKYTVTPPRYADLLALFNDQWRVKAIGPQQYEVQTQPSWDFVAKTTLNIDATTQPNIRQMLQAHMTKKSNKSLPKATA